MTISMAARNPEDEMGHARPSDEELMATIVEGQESALEALYDRYGGQSYSLALRILGDREAAEEVVQDAFVAVWRRAETYDPHSGRLYSWLLRITRNRAIDELRRRGISARHPSVGGRSLDSEPDPAQDREVPEAATSAELRSVVGAALDGLPHDQREVLEMAYMRGWSQREISRHTGVPLGTVKTRTRLALKKLRRALEPLRKEPVDLDGV
jgi:RNA polymerase sigma-70 factor (ECF subfamily)